MGSGVWTPPIGPHLWIRRPGLILPPLPVVPYPQWAAPALVAGQTVSNSWASASSSLAMPGNVTSGNLLLVAVAYDNSNSNVPTVTKASGTGTMGTATTLHARINTQAAALGNSTGANFLLFSASVTGSGSLTLTVAKTSGTFMGAVASEWSGLTTTLDGSAATDKTSINSGVNNTTVTANTVTTSLASSLILGYFSDDGGGGSWTSTPGTGYTQIGTGSTTGDPIFILYQVGNAGSYTPNASISNSIPAGSFAGIGALALAAVAPAATPPRPIIVRQAVQRAAVR